ncbi:Hypothetical protein UVM_LOCUS116, partial [uncultured virus]
VLGIDLAQFFILLGEDGCRCSAPRLAWLLAFPGFVLCAVAMLYAAQTWLSRYLSLDLSLRLKAYALPVLILVPWQAILLWLEIVYFVRPNSAADCACWSERPNMLIWARVQIYAHLVLSALVTLWCGWCIVSNARCPTVPCASLCDTEAVPIPPSQQFAVQMPT